MMVTENKPYLSILSGFMTPNKKENKLIITTPPLSLHFLLTSSTRQAQYLHSWVTIYKILNESIVLKVVKINMKLSKKGSGLVYAWMSLLEKGKKFLDMKGLIIKFTNKVKKLKNFSGRSY